MLSGKLPTQSSSKPSDEPPWPLGAVPSGKLPRPSSAEPISKLPRPSRPTSGMLCRSHRMLGGEASRARQQASERPPSASPSRKLYHSYQR
jgi:hypothetical protein